ncbi:hypothetical protein K456DRAFT_169441 [Colletotrichum gloeosporioides 23]|nr:hypothetical protein K456DRAFT_169441 [Colletotrichum gloeosporioides 23]
MSIWWRTFGAALCSTLIERRPFAQCSTDTAKPQHGVFFMVDRRGKESSTCCVYFGRDRTEPKTGCAKGDRPCSCLPFPCRRSLLLVCAPRDARLRHFSVAPPFSKAGALAIRASLASG